MSIVRTIIVQEREKAVRKDLEAMPGEGWTREKLLHFIDHPVDRHSELWTEAMDFARKSGDPELEYELTRHYPRPSSWRSRPRV